MLTSVSIAVLTYLFPAGIVLTCCVEDSIIILKFRKISIYKEEMVFICVVRFLEGFVNFLNQVQVASFGKVLFFLECFILFSSLWSLSKGWETIEGLFTVTTVLSLKFLIPLLNFLGMRMRKFVKSEHLSVVTSSI